MARGVDFGEKTLHTTSGNECKFSWDSKARRKTSMTIAASLERGKLYGDRRRSTFLLPNLPKSKFQPNVTISFSQILKNKYHRV